MSIIIPLLKTSMQKRKKIEIEYVLMPLAELGETDRALIQQAQNARFNAYAPYSNFQVGAAVLLDDGSMLSGSNQENRAFPSGLCAERVCLFHTAASFPNKKINKLAVVAYPKGAKQPEYAHPCGGCRQVMVEMELKQKQSFQVFLLYPNDEVLVLEKAADLLPFPFDAEL